MKACLCHVVLLMIPHSSFPQCEEVSDTKLMDLQPVLAGLPCCVVKRIKAEVILNETENLKQMSKCQLKAMLKEVSKERERGRKKRLTLLIKKNNDSDLSLSLALKSQSHI